MKAKELNKLFHANTEPSCIRNDAEGVETTVESLRQILTAVVNKLHEQFLISDCAGERYSPTLQEIVRIEDKELQDNKGVIYAPWNSRPYQATGIENSVTCEDLRVSQTTSSDAVKMFECGQFAAKSFERIAA